MRVILRSDIPKLGKRGDVKDVSLGYARNFLVPKKLVLEATQPNLKIWEREKKKIETERELIVQEAKTKAGNIEKGSFTVSAKVGEAGKLFGSVTNADVARVMEEQGLNIDKHDITLNENIKEVGVYTVDVKIIPEVTAKAKIWVVEEK